MLPEGIPFTVCWLVKSDYCPTLEYLLELAGTNPACFGSVIDKMKMLNDSRYLRMPHVRPLKGRAKGMFELRVIGGKQGFARLPLVLSAQREVILLFGQTKKGGSPPPGFIERAIDLRDQISVKEATYEKIDFEEFNE